MFFFQRYILMTFWYRHPQIMGKEVRFLWLVATTIVHWPRFRTSVHLRGSCTSPEDDWWVYEVWNVEGQLIITVHLGCLIETSSCMQKHTLQGKNDSVNSKLLKVLTTHRDNMMSKDFPFYLLIVHRMDTVRLVIWNRLLLQTDTNTWGGHVSKQNSGVLKWFWEGGGKEANIIILDDVMMSSGM